MKKRKWKIKHRKKIVIPPKIKEVISYLSFSFSSGLMDRKDNSQDLYLLYVQTIRKKPETLDQQPGWWYKRFKWYLLTKYRKSEKRINKEWEYIHS